MNRKLVAVLSERLVEHQLTGSRPDTGTAGVSLAPWKTGGVYGPSAVEIFVRGSQAAVVGAPASSTLGVELWGFQLGRWWMVDVLNDGAPVAIVSDQLGSAELVEGIAGFDRLFVAGAASAGAVQVGFAPLEILR